MGYLQVSEVYVVPQAAVSNVKESVLIRNESAQTQEKSTVSHTEPPSGKFGDKTGTLMIHFRFWTLGCQIRKAPKTGEMRFWEIVNESRAEKRLPRFRVRVASRALTLYWGNV